MSEQATEDIGFALEGDSAFSTLMDTLAPQEDSETGDQGGGTAGAPADPGGPTGTSGEASADPIGDVAGGDAGAGGESALPDGTTGTPAPADAVGAGGRAAGVGRVDVASIQSKFGEISLALEDNASKAFQGQALDAVRAEYPKYFDALKVHPRTLVNTEVPSMTGEGMERLRDSNDAKDWQDAVKAQLLGEIQERGAQLQEEQGTNLRIMHGSIEMFQNNRDLVPGTRQFDKQLADNVMKFARPYMLRDDNNKLIGFSIPIQPLIEQEREVLAHSRKAAPPPPTAQAAPGSSGKTGAAQTPAQKARQPQAGLRSKAGQSSEAENFDALFSTLGFGPGGIRI